MSPVVLLRTSYARKKGKKNKIADLKFLFLKKSAVSD